MIISRIVPSESAAYKSLSAFSKNFDGFMRWKPLSWFGFWILIAAGMAAYSGHQDCHLCNTMFYVKFPASSQYRFVFWDFSRWFIGVISLILITILSILFLIKNKLIGYGQEQIMSSKFIVHFLFSAGMFLIGWGGNIMTGAPHAVPYILAYLAIFFIYGIPIHQDKDTGENTVISNEKRWKYCLGASVLLIMSTIIGFVLDDPVISTASAVTFPFPFVSFLMKHGRHVQRARIYPILIMAIFVAMRQGWFLIPLFLLFYLLRYYHYFRYGIVFPTFAVDQKEG